MPILIEILQFLLAFSIGSVFLVSGGHYCKDHIAKFSEKTRKFLKSIIGVLAILGTVYTIKSIYEDSYLTPYLFGGTLETEKFIGNDNVCGKLLYSNGDYYIGFYKDGKRNGSGYSYFRESSTYQYRYYQYDKKPPLRIKEFIKSDEILNSPEYTYVDYPKDGKLDGVGVQIFKNGNSYIGVFKNGKRHGKGCSIYPENARLRKYKNGKSI